MSFFNELWDGLQGGFLRKPLKKATGLTDAQLLGAAGMAVAAPYALPAMGVGGTAGASGAATAAPLTLGGNVATNFGAVDAIPAAAEAAPSGGLLSTMSSYGKPAMTALQGATMAKGLLGQQQPIQGAQLNHQAPQFSGLLAQPQNDDQLRRQQYAQYVQNIGGRNGLA